MITCVGLFLHIIIKCSQCSDAVIVGEAADWYTHQTIDVATESSNGGEVDVKKMKLDVDAAAGGADDVTDAALYSGVTQQADELCFNVAAKHEPELDDSLSQSKC